MTDNTRFRRLVTKVLQEVRECRAKPPCPHCAAQAGNIVNAAQGIHPSAGHHYLSTSCLHAAQPGQEELHGYCQSTTGSNGETEWVKAPASCKFCGAPCVCTCHTPGAPSE